MASSSFEERLRLLGDEIATTFFDWGRIEQTLLSTPEWRDWARQFFPESIRRYECATTITIADHLEGVHTRLRAISDDYDVQTFYDERGAMLVFSRKQSGLTEASLATQGEFVFPEGEEGERMKLAYESFVRKGGSLSLPLSCFKGFTIPEFIRSQYNADDSSYLTVVAVPPETAIQCRMKILVEGRECTRVEGIDMRVLRGGTEEIIFSNAHQSTPWEVTAAVLFDDHRKLSATTIGLSAKWTGIGVQRALEASRLARCCARGAHVILEDVEHGTILARADAKPDDAPEEIDAAHEVLDRLDFIRQNTGARFTIPDDGIGDKDTDHIEWAYEAMRTGTRSSQMRGDFKVRMLGEQVGQVLEVFEGRAYQWVTVNTEAKLTILGVEINLGMVESRYGPVALSRSMIKRLKRARDEGEPSQEVEVVFRPRRDAKATREDKFVEWPKDVPAP